VVAGEKPGVDFKETRGKTSQNFLCMHVTVAEAWPSSGGVALQFLEIKVIVCYLL